MRISDGSSVVCSSVVGGQVPCTGAIMRVRPSGGPPELVAWGFRNPFGLAFSSDGRLYVTDNGFDERGSRPVFGTGDLMYVIEPEIGRASCRERVCQYV